MSFGDFFAFFYRKFLITEDKCAAIAGAVNGNLISVYFYVDIAAWKRHSAANTRQSRCRGSDFKGYAGEVGLTPRIYLPSRYIGDAPHAWQRLLPYGLPYMR